MSSKPRKTPKRETAVQKGLKTLEAYKSKDPVRNQLMQVIKSQYANRDIQNITKAVSAMKSLTNKNLNEFTKKFTKITEAIPKKMEQQAQKRARFNEEQDSKIGQMVEWWTGE